MYTQNDTFFKFTPKMQNISILRRRIRNEQMNPTQTDFSLGLEQIADSSAEHQVKYMAYVYGPYCTKNACRLDSVLAQHSVHTMRDTENYGKNQANRDLGLPSRTH